MESKKIKFPSPLSIALLLSAFVFLLALWTKSRDGSPVQDSVTELLQGWYNGLWDNSAGGLYFAFQMILILVLGHVLARTSPFQSFIALLTTFCTNNTSAVLTISITSILLGYLNWGLALVLSALMVKHVLVKFGKEKKLVNIGLIGAAAYSCMLVWHGGFSGSSPIKASESGAIKDMLVTAGYSVDSSFPEYIATKDTLFSNLNICVFFGLLILLPLSLYLISKKFSYKNRLVELDFHAPDESTKIKFNGAFLTGFLLLSIACFVALQNIGNSGGFLNVNFINFSLLGLGIMLHNSFERFSAAVQIAIQDASGILIQFPIYFGIIGLMKTSGLSILMSSYFVELSTINSFPIFTFLSAGLLNFFIPSGGGQFYIQGPMLVQSAIELGASIPKTIMALAYGDQWTNMLQPFWALPLLGITKIKLTELLPYCFVLFLVSGAVFIVALLMF